MTVVMSPGEELIVRQVLRRVLDRAEVHNGHKSPPDICIADVVRLTADEFGIDVDLEEL